MMSDDKAFNAISVWLNGVNYSYWAKVMKKFVVGKGMWSHVTGSIVKPTNVKSDDTKHEEYVTALAK